MECTCGCFVWGIMFMLGGLLLLANPAAFVVLMLILIVVKWFER